MFSESSPSDTRVVVVMSVAAADRTRIGSELARRLSWAFADGGDDHPEASRSRMRSRTRPGMPPTGADMAPWLERQRRRVVEHLTTGVSLVLASPGLDAAHRDILAGGDTRVVFIEAEAPSNRSSGEAVASALQELQAHLPG